MIIGSHRFAGRGTASGASLRRPVPLLPLLLAGVTLGGCAGRAPATTMAPARTLASVIDSIIAAPPLHRTHWGILVRDAATGRTLYSRNEDKHFIPASNTKLVVTLTALAELGPDWRYSTAIDALGGTAAEPALLVVRGRGDPTLSARFDSTELAALDTLARRVARAGVTRVAGDLIIDATAFGDERVHSTWEVGDLPFSYATPVAAFGVEEGTFRIVRQPGPSAGTPARVEELDAPGSQPLVARVRTDTAGAPIRWDIEFLDRRDTVWITGALPAGRRPDTVRLAVADPDAYAGRALRSALNRAGVAVAGAVHVVRDTVSLRTLAHGMPARTVAVRESPPVVEIAAAILKPSQNWIAEQLLKTLGRERGEGGTWRDGLAVERRFLAGIGIDSLAINLRDASGLSAQNLLTPASIVAMLEYAGGAPWASLYRDALPAAGEEGGTLSNRLDGLGDRVRAKTGTIANVASLSGYLVTQDGRDLVFSIMTNGSGLPSAPVRNAIDAIVRAIDEIPRTP